MSAQVVGKEFTEFFRVTRSSSIAGRATSAPHMPVISPDGVVGKVTHVTGDAVDVQLSVDAAFGLDVEDERTHARGFVRGTGDRAATRARSRWSTRATRSSIGDLLVTSGKGKWFPRGVPVARVTGSSSASSGAIKKSKPPPTVNFSRLDARPHPGRRPERRPQPEPSARPKPARAAAEGKREEHRVLRRWPRAPAPPGEPLSRACRNSRARARTVARPAAHPLHGGARVLGRARRVGRVRRSVTRRTSSASRRSASTPSPTSRSSARARRGRPARRADHDDAARLALAFTLVHSVMILVLLAIFGSDA